MGKKFVTLFLLFALGFVGIMKSQEAKRTVAGVVTDEAGQPIAGVSIRVDGTNIGTITDEVGSYSLNCAPASTFTFAFIGYEKQKVKIGNRTSINVKLHEEVNQLDEVMVVAYGTAKKSSYSGSAALVKQDALKDVPVTTFENALNGKVAGLQVTNSSGQAGEAPSIRIRGIGSMNASNDPLYVIDGVPVISGNVGQMDNQLYTTDNVMNTLNPEDIESISILKDAAASSLYGSRAANGVILITTKKGHEGRTNVSFQTSVGFTPSWATKNYEPANIDDQTKMLYMIFHDYCTSKGKSDADASSYAIWSLNDSFNKHGYQFSADGTGLNANITISDYDNSGRAGKYFDWNKAYYRTACYQNYGVTVSGATPTTGYYTSFGYTKDEGRIKINSFERLNGRVNLTNKVGKVLDFDTNVTYARTNTSGYNDSRTTGNNLFMETQNLLFGFYWPTNYKTGEDWTDRYGSYAYDALYYNTQWNNSSIDNKLSASETVTLHILPNLYARTILSYDNANVKDHLYYSAKHFLGSAENGEVDDMRTTYETTVSSTTANYDLTQGLHTLQLMAGFEAEKNTTDYLSATGINLATSTLQNETTAGTTTSSGYKWGNSMLSVLSKIDYNYNQRYYGSFSYRRDGSSKLSKNERWGDFWSLAGSWNIHSEDFMKQFPTVSTLRVRASYGVNGTLPTDNYGYMNLVTYSSKYMGQPGGTQTTIANNNLSWETSYTYNLGLDFGLFRNRLQGTIEYFNRTSKNLLQDVPISTVTGFSSILQNIGSINNNGVEIELSGDIIKTHDLVWSASVNTSFLSSKVKKLYNKESIIWYDPTGSDNRAQYIYEEGKSTLAFYGYEWAGVDKTNGKSVYYTNDGTTGDFTYKGRAATYSYSKANYTIIGNAIPDAYGGFNTNVSYKGVDFGLNFTYKIGGDLYDGAYKDMDSDGYYWERLYSKSYFKHMWTEENPNGDQPKIRGIDLKDAMQYSSRHICNASYLRLKSMSLGYTVPRTLTSKAFIQNLRIFFNATNLLTFSKYKEADPEVNDYGTRGWETPIGKTFVFGLNLKF